jgi:hypothetical protein
MPSIPEDYSRIPTSVKVVIGLMVALLIGFMVMAAFR